MGLDLAAVGLLLGLDRQQHLVEVEVAAAASLVADVEVVVLPQADGGEEVVRLVRGGAGAVGGAHRRTDRHHDADQEAHHDRGGPRGARVGAATAPGAGAAIIRPDRSGEQRLADPRALRGAGKREEEAAALRLDVLLQRLALEPGLHVCRNWLIRALVGDEGQALVEVAVAVEAAGEAEALAAGSGRPRSRACGGWPGGCGRRAGITCPSGRRRSRGRRSPCSRRAARRRALRRPMSASCSDSRVRSQNSTNMRMTRTTWYAPPTAQAGSPSPSWTQTWRSICSASPALEVGGAVHEAHEVADPGLARPGLGATVVAVEHPVQRQRPARGARQLAQREQVHVLVAAGDGEQHVAVRTGPGRACRWPGRAWSRARWAGGRPGRSGRRRARRPPRSTIGQVGGWRRVADRGRCRAAGRPDPARGRRCPVIRCSACSDSEPGTCRQRSAVLGGGPEGGHQGVAGVGWP